MWADSSPVTSLDLVAEKPAYLVGSDVRIRNDVQKSLMGTYDRASTIGSSSSYRLSSTLSKVPNACTTTTFNKIYTDTGLFGIYATGEPPELDDMVVPIMEELVRNCFKVDEAHLENAKTALNTSLLGQLDGPTGIAEEIGRQLLVFGRRIPISEWFAHIDAVDAEAIKRISNKYIFDREMAIMAMGPIHFLPDHNFIRRRTYTNLF